MRSIHLSVDETIFDQVVNFLKLLPRKKVRLEEIVCSKELEEELNRRKKEVKNGDVIPHDKFWDQAIV